MASCLMDSDEIFRTELASALDERDGVIQAVLSRLEAAGCPVDPYFDRLALDELLTNAIVHGNEHDRTRKVIVRAFSSRDHWGIEVADEGQGFDWRSHLERLKRGVDPSATSGRGIALIQGTGAQLHFLEGGRRVQFVRERRSHRGEGPEIPNGGMK